MGKLYTTYLYFFYDESIEEENTAYQTLTKEFGDSLNTTTAMHQGYNFHQQDCWLGHKPSLDISRILTYRWQKEDVDIFVKKNPECIGLNFKIWKERMNILGKNWLEYCPLIEQRESLINEIIS